jgi:hypothetical protein
MGFTPTPQPAWPSDRALILIHGIGDASAGGALPTDAVRAALGAAADEVAIYEFTYDFVNDWAAAKLEAAAAAAALGAAVATRFGDPAVAHTIAEYAGDVLWPILHHDTRFAIREALVAQMLQVVEDCGESALAQGLDPRDYRVGIIAHSLGCFHTYELLHAAVREPAHRLRPGSDHTILDSVTLMASPVQLIRSVAGEIRALVPSPDELATLDPAGLAIPAERVGARSVAITRRLVSVTGTQDPVGGHLLGSKRPFAFMNIPGQETIRVPQSLLPNVSPATALAAALTPGAPHAGGLTAPNPHSWADYIAGQSSLLQELFT